jgi:hypothetical protein
MVDPACADCFDACGFVRRGGSVRRGSYFSSTIMQRHDTMKHALVAIVRLVSRRTPVCLCCRAAQTIELSTGTTMPYDLLILTPGLQNTTLATVAACGVQGVCSPQELRAHFTRGDAAAAAAGGPEQRIIVYGDTLEATDSLAVLEERGVDLGRGTVHVAPPPGAGGPDPVVTFMRQVCPLRGMLFCHLRAAAAAADGLEHHVIVYGDTLEAKDSLAVHCGAGREGRGCWWRHMHCATASWSRWFGTLWSSSCIRYVPQDANF